MNKQETIKAAAEKIKRQGFRVFLAQNGLYGFYTDNKGTRIVCFQFYICGGIRFFGNYKTKNPKYEGTGWELKVANYQDMFDQYPSFLKDWKYKTLKEYLSDYQSSSKFEEVK